VSFRVGADAYDRFMGRYSVPLAVAFADFAGIEPGATGRVLDVGCGPGALTAELVRRVGADRVAAADPSAPFVDAARARQPDVDIRQSPAEDLPFDDGAFDAALAQLVVHFMADPVVGLGEMRRVVRPGGVVAACVWDFGSGRGPLSAFWSAATQLDPDAPDEVALPGSTAGQLTDLCERAGLADVDEALIAVTVEHADFDDWWEPYTFGVGPAGAYVAGLADERRAELREACRASLPSPPFTIEAAAWAARGRA
jgi:ubiquinone/menaquinone biosynthesis C-methylase UbiE